MPRIYAASLTDYNNGILHGRWIDLDGKDAEDIQTEIDAMLTASPAAAKGMGPAEEWAIHDSEDCGKLGENPDLEDLEAIGAADPDTLPLLLELVDLGVAQGVAAAAEYYSENYQGAYRTLGDYAESFLADCGDLQSIPEGFRNYIDFDAWGRDAELNGDIFTIEQGGVLHVFLNH